MATAEEKETLTPSDDDASETEEQLEALSLAEPPQQRGILSKWTNYIHGWQDRYFVLKEATFSYYKSEEEISFGCRGAVSLQKAAITPHDFDECRFDVAVGDSLWYLRAKDDEQRQRWMDYLELHKHQSESGYGSDQSLRRQGSITSMLSITSGASLSATSTSSGSRGRGLREKLAEMETFREILSRQVDTLQGYFDACAQAMSGNSLHDSQDEVEDPDETLNGATSGKAVLGHQSPIHMLSPKEIDGLIRQHGAHAIDFKGESFTFKATTAGIIATLSHCVDLMNQREDAWKKRLEKEAERRKRLQDKLRQLNLQMPAPRALIGGPDMEEGPHCKISEEEFFDAVDSALDKLEKEAESRTRHNSARDSPKPTMALQPQHRFYEDIQTLVSEHVRWARTAPSDEKQGWQLIAEEGEMKVFKREVEEDGIVCDPIKATYTVKGVTGHELCHHFWAMDVRMEWEATIETCSLVEHIAEDTVVTHQVMKRVWPTAQRDSLFWSHIRHVTAETDEGPDYWIVVNKSCDHPDSAAVVDRMVTSKCVRVDMNIALLTQTVITPPRDGKEITRDDIQCKIMYCSYVNPGGWAPASVLRAVYKREYPKFVKRFTQYVMEKTASKPILF